MPAQDKAAWTGLVNQAQFDVFRGKLLNEFIDGIQRAADDAVTADFSGVGRCDGNGEDGLVRSRSLGLRPVPSHILFGASQEPQIFVDVEAEVMNDLAHGCLVSLCGHQRPSFMPGV
jgi:hypothetical protein